MMLWPCLYSPSGASPRRKLHTLSSIGPHILGNSAHVVAAATTAVGVGSTVFTVTSTVMARSIRRSRDPHVTIRRSTLRHHHRMASLTGGFKTAAIASLPLDGI